MRARVKRLGAAGVTAVALVAGLLSGAGPAGAAEPVMPGWLVPLMSQEVGDGRARYCSAVQVGPGRVAAAPGCFTGRESEKHMLAWFGSDDGDWEGATYYPRYRIHPQYDPATGRAAFAVAQAGEYERTAPVLASAADGALYAAGTQASFFSWTGSDPAEIRTPHTERAVVKSAADCAALLGRPLASGTLCTSPAPGAAEVPRSERCVGDAGGALVAGGKVIGISATPSTGCASSRVRLYTSVRAHRSTLVEWGRDSEIRTFGDQAGGVVAREGTSFQGLVDFCGTSNRRSRDCGVDSNGSTEDYAKAFPLLTALGDADGDGIGELLARRTDGNLYRMEPIFCSSLSSCGKVLLGSNFGIYNTLLAPRDLSGDGYNDLVGRDSAGVLWLHRGTADGKFPSRARIGSGWGQYTAIAGRGDYSGDGRSDLVARDSAGTLWLFRGNGAGGFSGATRIGGGWNAYNAVVGSGDIDADGRQDIVTRTPAGAAYVYNADGKGNFLPRKQWATTQWKNYLRIG
ncbi:FG-GAP-like repeat-containing protein [Streptomyces sp. NPDC101132]|uniref:FG-GAP-like repeat-containing protein n=1 Tax=Streptomyces sp. NPDC101132 TaxID=3366110 RepID=UPI00381A24F1